MVTSRQVEPVSTALRRGRDVAADGPDPLGVTLVSVGGPCSEFR
jgi:hypothetical protein